MKEQLQNRAMVIKGLLVQHPQSGADLLMDFAREYAAHQSLEDKVILLKLDLSASEEENETKEIVQELLAVVDEVVGNYNEEAIKALVEKEKALAEKVKQLQLPDDVVVKVNNLVKTYASTNFRLEVADLELRLGEITGLVGENATGKTTLLKILAGELAHDKGQLSYPLFQKKKSKNWLQLKKQIAYVPQELPKWKGSLMDNLRYEAAIHGIRGAANKKAVKYILGRLGLVEHIDKSWRQLSGGYKLRFSLAKAMVWPSKLLIIDEPLAFLDIKAQMIVLNDLQNLAKSLHHPMAIILSSQHLHEIEAVADQLLFMRGGQLENLRNPSDFRKERTSNLFEIGCSISYAAFIKHLEGYVYEDVLFNGLSFIISSPLTSTGFELLNHLAKKQVKVHYYRDISQSSKTKFYEQDF